MSSIFDFTSILNLVPVPTVLLDSKGSVLLKNSEWDAQLLGTGNLIVSDFKTDFWQEKLRECFVVGKNEVSIPNDRKFTMEIKTFSNGLAFILCQLKPAKDAGTGDRADEAVQRLKIKDMSEMAATLAHEINNPLTVIYAKVQLLKAKLSASSGEEIDFVKANLEKISLHSERIFKIVSGMRSLSRDARKDPLTLVSLKRIIDETMSLVISMTRDVGIQIELNHFDHDLAINCRPSEIIQVMLNIVTNAIHAVEKLPNPQISIDVKNDTESVFIFVSDSGEGVSIENESKIFTSFFTTKPVGQGTGIGLSVSAKIVASHDGKLRLNRSKGPSCFEIKFPLAKIVNKAA